MRPANILTAWADILLGFAASGAVLYQGFFTFQFQNLTTLPFLILATTGLYGGGVVLNDYFDYQLDVKERPERPLPSGEASLLGAFLLGFGLLGLGILAAWFASELSAWIAANVFALVLWYDSSAKHQAFLGPLVMGSCRGANLLLGMSIFPQGLSDAWFLAFVPIVYIFAITMVSRGEVNGGNRLALIFALLLYSLTLGFILGIGFFLPYQFIFALPFAGLWAYLVFPPLWKAMQTLEAKQVFKAVKAGVLALIVLDAALAAGFAGIEYGIFILLLLPISMKLAKLFSVS